VALNDSFRVLDGQVQSKRQDLVRLKEALAQAQKRVRSLTDLIEAKQAELDEQAAAKRDLAVAIEWKAERDRKDPEPPKEPPAGPPGQGGNIVRDGNQGF
jgi:flagellar motility protein MotE (MotC chaperone)